MCIGLVFTAFFDVVQVAVDSRIVAPGAAMTEYSNVSSKNDAV